MKNTKSPKNLSAADRQFLAEIQQKIRLAQKSLYIIAALNLIIYSILFFLERIEFADYLLAAFLCGIYFLCAFWAAYIPFPAFLVGLSLVLISMAMQFLEDPRSLSSGILIKMILIYILVNGVINGYKAQQILKDS